MSDARRPFLASQAAGLAPLEFLVVVVPAPPFLAVQVRRDDQGGWAVGVGSRDEQAAFSDDQAGALGGLGFVLGEGSWSVDVDGADAAAAIAEEVLTTVLGVEAGAPVNLRHGSALEEHLAAQKLAAMRGQLEPIIRDLTGAEPVIDEDGDYVVVVDESQVFVAPRAMPGRLPVVRVFAITNAGVQMTPDLGMYLSRLNFTLMFGRFSVDTEHGTVWLDETLLGEHVTDEELRFTISMVASAADEWDDKIAQLFGGQVRQPAGAAAGATGAQRSKPGEGGYL